MKPRGIIGYECSGRTRQAFRALGYDVISCDILPSEDDSPHHIIADIFSVLSQEEFSFGIFHPPCTYLTVSAEWAYKNPPFHQQIGPHVLTGAARREARELAIENFRKLLTLPFPKAIENPKGVISTRIRPPDQIIHPNYFGENARKETHLWLDRLPPLVSTSIVPGQFRGGKYRWANQSDCGAPNAPPSDHRQSDRSRTYLGIASAFASQWGPYAA